MDRRAAIFRQPDDFFQPVSLISLNGLDLEKIGVAGSQHRDAGGYHDKIARRRQIELLRAVDGVDEQLFKRLLPQAENGLDSP